MDKTALPHWQAYRSRTRGAGGRAKVTIDQIAIDLALLGAKVELTMYERQEAIRQGRQRGLSYRQLQALLHVSDKTILRALRAGELAMARVDAEVTA